MSKPKDQQLYDRIKKKIYNEISNHSAYRSGHLVKEYKKAYKKKYNSDDAYEGKKNKEGLERWFKEDWRNQRGEVGYKKKGDVYRPTKRVNKNTPLTFNELSKNEIKKGMEKKKKNGRVDKFRK
jgi:hypothetical protein